MMWIVWIMFLVGAAIASVRSFHYSVVADKLMIGFSAQLEEHMVVPWRVQGVPHPGGYQSFFVDMLDSGDFRARSKPRQLLHQ